MCELADNFRLMQFMKIAPVLGEVSRERRGSSMEVRRDLLSSYRALVSALRSHDADRAESAMVEHLERVERAALVLESD